MEGRRQFGLVISALCLAALVAIRARSATPPSVPPPGNFAGSQPASFNEAPRPQADGRTRGDMNQGWAPNDSTARAQQFPVLRQTQTDVPADPPSRGPAPEGLPAPGDSRGGYVAPQYLPGNSLVTREGPVLDLVEFREVPLAEAARLLSDQSGLKIVPSAEAGKVLITLYLRKVKAGVAIDALTKAHGLFYREDPESGLIRIYTTKEYETDLGNFREERTEVFTLLYPNPLHVAYAIRGAFGDRVLLSLNGLQIDSEQLQDLVQRFSRFNLIDQQNRELGGFFGGAGGVGTTGVGGTGVTGFGAGAGGTGFGTTSTLGGVGGISGFGGLGGYGAFGNVYGGGTGGYAGGVNSPYGQINTRAGDVSQINRENLSPEQIQALERARAAGDQQVVEEILRTRRADIFVTAVPRNNQLIVRTSDLAGMQKIRELVTQLDVPTPLVLLEVQILSLDLGDDFSSAFDYQFSDGKLTSGGFNTNVDNFTMGNILPPAADAGGDTRFEPLAPGAAGGVPAKNLTFQIVSSNFRMRMQLLESKNRVTQLATPILLTANNEVSHLFIGSTIPIVLGFNPGTIISNVGAQTVVPPTPITVPQNIGQSLMITPNINADRTVTLRVAQENSALNGTTNIPVPVGDQIVEQPVDIVERTTVTGTIVAKDGCTVAIGGLIREDLSDVRTEIPIIGKLPVIGFFFRGQETMRTRRELVVLIRPYVFNTPQETAVVSHNLIQDLSLHPHANHPFGTLNSFSQPEVLVANPPQNELQMIFRFHSLEPKVY